MDSFHDIIKASQQLNPRCPICNIKYKIQRIQILEESEGGVLSYFTCHHCASSFLASVMETPFGHVAAGLLTDLQADEVIKFADGEVVTHDDVLEVYEKLERGKFDFHKYN